MRAPLISLSILSTNIGQSQIYSISYVSIVWYVNIFTDYIAEKDATGDSWLLDSRRSLLTKMLKVMISRTVKIYNLCESDNFYWHLNLTVDLLTGQRMCICHLPCRNLKPSLSGDQVRNETHKLSASRVSSCGNNSEQFGFRRHHHSLTHSCLYWRNLQSIFWNVTSVSWIRKKRWSSFPNWTSQSCHIQSTQTQKLEGSDKIHT